MIRDYIIQVVSEMNSEYPNILSQEQIDKAIRMFENSDKSYEESVKEIDALRERVIKEYLDRKEAHRNGIYYYGNAVEDERESRTFSQVKEAQVIVQSLLDKYGLKMYISGGTVPYFLLNEDSGRLHDDIDTVCRMEDMDKLRQVFMEAGLYDPEWDSKTFSPDGGDYGFEIKVGGVPVGFYPFEYDKDARLITQYSADPYIKVCKTKLAPVEELTDYVMSYQGRDGKTYDTMSLEYIKLTKDSAGRPKDIADSKKIVETGLLRPEVMGRVHMYTEYIHDKPVSLNEPKL